MSDFGGDGELVEVHLRGFPVVVHRRASEHQQELQREFQLILIGAADGPIDVPKRLFELIDVVTTRFAGVSDPQTREIEEADLKGVETIDDLIYRVPPATSAACVALSRMLDECDDYCREGGALLTLSSPDEALAYRRWYLGEFVAQLGGHRPLAWPDADHRALLATPELRGET
ncbi:MAG TPA: hypothetical protein VF230_05175 [Acidimicrobiales bacterium]